MQFNIHKAKTQFSKLVAAVENGEEVVICRNGVPVVRCVPAETATPAPFGAWKALVPEAGSLGHMAKPTDDDLLDEMGL